MKSASPHSGRLTPTGPEDEKRPADVIGSAVKIARIATEARKAAPRRLRCVEGLATIGCTHVPMLPTLAAIEAELALIRLSARGYEHLDGVLIRDNHSTTRAEGAELKLNLARFDFLVGEAARVRRAN